MTFLVIKKIKGNEYLYAIENMRVDGKVKRKKQIYLGRLDKIKDLINSTPEKPTSTKHFDFGLPLAVYSMLRKCKVAEAIDEVLPRKPHDGPTLGQMMEIAVINRATKPRSRKRLPEWYEKTCLPHVYDFDLSPHFSQNMWNNLNELTAEQVRQIESIIFERIKKIFDLKLEVLLFDPTNFYTYIEEHEGNELPGFSGHDKHKRNDCAQISFALCATVENIPLFHETHPGRTGDTTMFDSMMNNWFNEVSGPYTLVIDKGNNKTEIFEKIQKAGNHLIGCLKPSQHKTLISTPLEEFDDVMETADEKEFRMHRTTVQAYGGTYTVIITFNSSLYKRQHGLLQRHIEERMKMVEDFLATKLNTNKWTEPEVVEKHLQGILNYHELKGCYKVTARRKRGRGMGRLAVEIKKDEEKLQYLHDHCGKNLIFTDLHDWANWKIVEVSHSRWMVEDEFRKINCPKTISVRPMFVWRDGSIRAYHLMIFLTLQALMLMHREVRKKGLDVSYEQMIENLEEIWETRQRFPGKGVYHVVNDFDPIQKKLTTIFDLKRYQRE